MLKHRGLTPVIDLTKKNYMMAKCSYPTASNIHVVGLSLFVSVKYCIKSAVYRQSFSVYMLPGQCGLL